MNIFRIIHINANNLFNSTYGYCLVLVGKVPLQLVPGVPVHSQLMVNMLQCLPHLVLAGFDSVHLPHQVVLRVVVHQIDPLPEMSFPLLI